MTNAIDTSPSNNRPAEFYQPSVMTASCGRDAEQTVECLGVAAAFEKAYNTTGSTKMNKQP
jgi:hypothetical protein